MRGSLIAPHGGTLRDCMASPEEAQELQRAARDLPSWDLTARQLCDIELLLNGGFSPLEGFLGQADYERVVQELRLADGNLWPMPVTLDVSEAFAQSLAPGQRVALRDPEGVLIAVLEVSDVWGPDKGLEAERVYGTRDEAHPGVYYLQQVAHPFYVGGRLRGLQLPLHYDFRGLRHTPRELRDHFRKLGWQRVVAFHTRTPMHKVHQQMAWDAARQVEANLLIHPVVGITRPGDIDHYSRVRCYEHVIRRYLEQTTALSLLPLAMRLAGPREALWHAIIRQNYGCTHLLIGKNHAGPVQNALGEDYYSSYEAQELIGRHQDELAIQMVPFRKMRYVRERAQYLPVDRIQPGQTVLRLSETEFHARLRDDLEIPDWFSYPEVIEELRRTLRPRHQQGFTVFFTGLSGAGKSTIARTLLVKLLEMGGRSVTLLDGDIVRKNLSSELGFSREHRDINVMRIGFVASQITKHGGIAICAPIAPYALTRRKIREMIAEEGGFIEIHVATPLDVCESRDRKGLYAKARAGLIKEFTGISDPYEAPEDPEMVIDTRECSPDEAVQRVLLRLQRLGFIK